MSHLQARRADFAEYCETRGITSDDEKTRLWLAFSNGWESCANRVWGSIEAALEVVPASNSRTFPVLNGGGRHIPWTVAEKAYFEYAKRHPGQSMERIASRGGFAESELDNWYPAWRQETDEVERMRAVINALPEALNLEYPLDHQPFRDAFAKFDQAPEWIKQIAPKGSPK